MALFSETDKSATLIENSQYLERTLTKFDAKTAINKNLARLITGQNVDNSLNLSGLDEVQYFNSDITIANDITVSGKKTLIIK